MRASLLRQLLQLQQAVIHSALVCVHVVCVCVYTCVSQKKKERLREGEVVSIYPLWHCTSFCLLFSADYYVKVMKKVQEKGGEFVKSEKERIGRILSK